MSKHIEPVAAGEQSKIDDAKLTQFLSLVGENVRKARARKGISRRILSQWSQVSERYLAQLECGKGNVSIGLLLKIAAALDISIERLVAEEDPWNSELAMTRFLLNDVDPERRDRLLRMLESRQSGTPRAHRIALIGLRGAGKSTLGQLAATKLGVTFLELNSEIEKATGMPVHEVFALYDQEGYRRLEHQALKQLVENHDELILAVSGGIVSVPETYKYLLENYHTIWLRAEPEEHMARVRGQGDERPMTGYPDAMEDLRNILVSREVHYANANARVNTSNASLEESLELLLEAIEKNGFLGGEET